MFHSINKYKKHLLGYCKHNRTSNFRNENDTFIKVFNEFISKMAPNTK
jgi:hypothetical protein